MTILSVLCQYKAAEKAKNRTQSSASRELIYQTLEHVRLANLLRLLEIQSPSSLRREANAP